ncbi:hypothetical protein ACQQCD_02260 [Pseudarthrobacter sp. J1763]|uniref:hypothetical protein n=1 Tax=Pseudarthrobacter sp. J1763 TaxID=3420445 RepID=UPI003D264EAE
MPRVPLKVPLLTALATRVLIGAEGAGAAVVGFVPEDAGSPLHYAGAVTYFEGC